jgi:hypothetical protein
LKRPVQPHGWAGLIADLEMLEESNLSQLESAELQRLEKQHVHAEQEAAAVLKQSGINSLAFLEANETVRHLVSRMRRLEGIQARRNWMT